MLKNRQVLESVKDPNSCVLNGLIISAGLIGQYMAV